MKDNKKPNQNDNRRQNLTGVVTLIIWSLIITIGINYVIGHTANRGSVEIKFSELVEMVKEDQVTEVKLESGKYTVTLTEEGGQEWLTRYYQEQGKELPEGTEVPTLYTTPLNYTDFLLLLEEHGVAFYSPYHDQNVITEFLVSYILPMALMVLAMIVFFRFAMNGRMGGGIGAVQVQRKGVCGEVHRRHLPGCGRPGRGEGVSGGDYRLSPLSGEVHRDRRKAPEGRIAGRLSRYG